MTRNAVRLAAVALGLVATASLAEAQVARPVTFGVSAGAAVPMGDIDDVIGVGYTIQGSLGYTPATIPVGFRADLFYNGFGSDGDASLGVFGLAANATVDVGGSATVNPYLIGGLGMYRQSFEFGGADESETDLGINAGAGMRFNLAGMSTFAEVRFHNVFGDESDSQFIPITFGINF